MARATTVAEGTAAALGSSLPTGRYWVLSAGYPAWGTDDPEEADTEVARINAALAKGGSSLRYTVLDRGEGR